MPYANNKGADQPVHPRSLISTFVVCCLDSIIPPVHISKISSLYLASVAVQAGLSLLGSQTPKTGFLIYPASYCNVPMFSDTQVWANSADPDQTAPLIRANSVCHSVCSVKVKCLHQIMFHTWKWEIYASIVKYVVFFFTSFVRKMTHSSWLCKS